MPDPPITPHLELRQAHEWTAAAIFQAKRLQRLLEAQTADGLPSTWSAETWKRHNEANRIGRETLTEEIEAYYLLSSMMQVMRWINRAGRLEPNIRPALRVFRDATRHVEDMRDMREHEDEYLTGGGRRRHRYRLAEGVGPGFNPSAHCIVVRGDEYWIGGRIELSQTLAALEPLRVELAKEWRAKREAAKT